MDEIELTTSKVICHTADCENTDIPIVLACAEVVICGPCGQQITDITPV